MNELAGKPLPMYKQGEWRQLYPIELDINDVGLNPSTEQAKAMNALMPLKVWRYRKS